MIKKAEEIIGKAKKHVAREFNYSDKILGSAWEYAMQITHRTKKQIFMYESVCNLLAVTINMQMEKEHNRKKKIDSILLELSNATFKKGDLIYYNLDSERCYGIVTEIKGKKVWVLNLGDEKAKEFQKETGCMPIKDCTLESDWSKIKGFKNIPNTKKPRKWTVNKTVDSDDGMVVSKDEITLYYALYYAGEKYTIIEAKDAYKKLGASLKIHKRYFS